MASATPTGRDNARVLVVEDSERMRQEIRRALRASGLTWVDEAADAEAALLKLRDADYDLVICDWHMPQVTGLELLRRIRAVPGLRALPVLLASASVTRARIREALAAGVSGFLEKAYLQQTLETEVRAFLGPRPEAEHSATA